MRYFGKEWYRNGCKSENIAGIKEFFDCSNQIKLYKPIIIENCKLKNAWCISDEIYSEKSICEFHLMCDIKVDERYGNLSHFTVKCSTIEISLRNHNCLIKPN